MQLSTELVHTGRWDIFTTSVLVAEKLEVPHKVLIQTIDRILEKYGHHGASTFWQKFVETVTVNKQKRKYRSYDMNEQAFIKLVMNLGRYDKAEIIQDLFITAFFRMRELLLQHKNTEWINARDCWKEQRKIETDTIKEFIEYAKKQWSESADKYYMHFTTATYRALDILHTDRPVRDILNRIWLTYLTVAEDQVVQAIREWMSQWLHYKEIFQNAKQRLVKMAEILPDQTKLLSN